MKWDWIGDNVGLIAGKLGEHLYLSLLPVVLGLAVALPLGFVIMRYPRLYAPVLTGSGVLYSIPSLSLFIVLPGILGTQILDPVNVVVALAIYTVALLVRTVVDGLRSVPDHVRQAAVASQRAWPFTPSDAGQLIVLETWSVSTSTSTASEPRRRFS